MRPVGDPSSASQPSTIVFAGGGTGGTVGPGIAIAERMRERRPDLVIRFLVSDRAVDRRLLDPGGWDARSTPARSPAMRPMAAIRFLRAWRATRRLAASCLGESDRPRVVALGGFVAPPVVAAATGLGVPVDLLNLDAVAGRANRWIAARATRCFSSVPTDLPEVGDPIGVPLRRAVRAIESPAVARAGLGLDPDRRTLLVTGASQGARSIDRFMLGLLERTPAVLAGWQVVHLAGEEVEQLSDAYGVAGVRATVRPFLETMGLAWSAADLAISRGGASSVAEIAASRTPSIVLPYPWHKDRHQARNAAALEATGAVLVLDDPVVGTDAAEALSNALRRILGDERTLASMREAFPPAPADAASRLADAILDPGSWDAAASGG